MPLTNAERQRRHRQRAGTRLSVPLTDQTAAALDRLSHGFDTTKRAVIERIIQSADARTAARLAQVDREAYRDGTLARGTLRGNGQAEAISEHRRLFSIPKPVTSNATDLAIPHPLPEQKRVTGDLEVDAYLWLREVCRTTTNPNDLDKAEQAAAKINACVDELGKRYAGYLIAQGMDSFRATMMSFFTPIPKLAEAARERISVTSEGLAIFGSYAQAMMPTPAEQMLERTVGELPEGYCWDWKQPELIKLFERSVNPATLTEAAAELRYWTWLSEIRSKMEQTEGEYSGDEEPLLSGRRFYVENLLCELPPRDRTETMHLVSAVRAGLVGDETSRHARIFAHLLERTI